MNALLEARAIVAEATRTPIESLPEYVDVLTLPAWDSMAHVSIILAIEEKTGQQLTTEAIIEIQSLQTIANLLDLLSGIGETT